MAALELDEELAPPPLSGRGGSILYVLGPRPRGRLSLRALMLWLLPDTV